MMIYQLAFSQQEKIDQIEKKLELADSLYHSNQLNQAITLSLEVYNFDYRSLIIPEREDEKWNYYMSFFVGNSKSSASFILGQTYFNQAKYDSSLYFLNQVLLPINFAAIRHYTYSLEMDIHLTYLKSVCLEKTNQDQKALSILTRYLFLDRIQTTKPGWFTQNNLVIRYRSLQKEEIHFDINRVVLVPKDSIRFFSWHQYHGIETGLYYRVDDEFCPVLPGLEYRNLANKVTFYPDQLDPTNPFQTVPRKIDYEKAKELLPLMYYFKGE